MKLRIIIFVLFPFSSLAQDAVIVGSSKTIPSNATAQTLLSDAASYHYISVGFAIAGPAILAFTQTSDKPLESGTVAIVAAISAGGWLAFDIMSWNKVKAAGYYLPKEKPESRLQLTPAGLVYTF